jgi:preprotein translocase subunit YajC
MSKLSAGDEVVTTAGIYGTVTELEDDETLLLEVAEGTEIRIAKAAIARILLDVPATDVADADPDAGPA